MCVISSQLEQAIRDTEATATATAELKTVRAEAERLQLRVASLESSLEGAAKQQRLAEEAAGRVRRTSLMMVRRQ